MSGYGCYNREPLQDMLPMPAIYTREIEGHQVVCADTVLIPNVFAKDCQYTRTELGKVDKECHGCKWREE